MTPGQEIGRFLRSHWWHSLLVPPAALVVTWLHEHSHAAAARAFGAVVHEISVLPGTGDWGHMTYELPPGASEQAHFWVSVAPYLVGFLVGVCGSLLVGVARLALRVRAALFIWLAVVPFMEPAYGILSWASGGPCDLRDAFGAPGFPALAAIAVYAAAVVAGLWVVQRRALSPPLSWRPYVALASATAAALLFLASVPLP